MNQVCLTFSARVGVTEKTELLHQDEEETSGVRDDVLRSI